jgi:hypothetical protein
MESVGIVCPTEAILADLLRIVRVGDSHKIHPLTKRLIEGAPLRDILYPNPKVVYDSDV